MKKKCANGGVVKKPMTMQEQLASVRGKVRPGYASGGIPGIDEPVSLSGNFLSRQPIESGIGATAIQSGEYPVNAPGSTPQSLGTLGNPDYSTGPRQGGFVNEDGTPRPTQQAAAQNPLADQISSGQALANLSNTERYKLGGSGTAAEASAIGAKNDILQGMNASIAKSNPVQSFVSPEQPVQQIQGSRRRRNSQPQGVVSFASGGPVFRDGNTFSDRPLMPEPGNYPQRIANPRPMPRPIAAAQPVRIPLPPPEYPQERVKPAAVDSGAPVGTYPGVTGIADAIRNRKVKNAEAADYAAGGMVKFSGPGGPRDDKIPVKVAGAEINVSNGENAVILPAKTAANPAALQAINGIIQATNDGRQPRQGIASGLGYAQGGIGWLTNPNDLTPEQKRIEAEQRNAAVSANAQEAQGKGILYRAFNNPNDLTAGQKTAAAGRQDAFALENRGALSNQLAPAPYTPPAVKELYGDDPYSAGDYPYLPVVSDSPARQSAPAQVRAIDNASLPAQGIASSINPAKTPEDAARMQNVAANDGMTTTQMGRGFDPTKLTMADGYGMASNAAGKTVSAGPSEYVGADGKPTSRWTDTAAYKDAIARNERDKIRLAEMQAVRLGANPQQALQASQGIAQAAQQSGLAQQERQIAIEQAPQQFKQAQQAAGQAQQVQQFAIDKAAREQSLIDAWDKAETPEQKQAIAGQLKIMRGQQEKEGQFDATKGGQAVDPATGQIIDLPPVIFNKSTGQPVQQAQSAQQAVPPADKRTVGQTYQTPKGPMIWRGNGWEAAR